VPQEVGSFGMALGIKSDFLFQENQPTVLCSGGGILGAFAKLRKATTSFAMSARPSVRTEQLGSHWTHGFFMKFDI
jgi:hypothetical protein